jgi:hypothetical protein
MLFFPPETDSRNRLQELKTQLETTIAEVEAIAEQLEKRKSSPESAELRRKASETAPPKPSQRRVSSGDESATSSQPRPTPRTLKSDDAKQSSAAKEESGGKVFLRQSSWASREQVSISIFFILKNNTLYPGGIRSHDP